MAPLANVSHILLIFGEIKLIASVEVVKAIFASAKNGSFIGELTSHAKSITFIFEKSRNVEGCPKKWLDKLGAQVVGSGANELYVIGDAIFFVITEASNDHQKWSCICHSLNPIQNPPVSDPGVNGGFELAIDAS